MYISFSFFILHLQFAILSKFSRFRSNTTGYLKMIIDFMQALISWNTWEWLSACNSSKLAAQDYKGMKLGEIRAVVFIVHHYPFILFPDSTSIKRSPTEQLHVSAFFSRAQHFRKVSRYIKIGRPVLSLLIIVLRIAFSLSFLASPPPPPLPPPGERWRAIRR